MTDSKVIQLNSPVEDSLNEVLKRGAQQLLAKAVEAEVAELLDQYSALQVEGKKGGSDVKTVSRLYLVDLSGSESTLTPKTHLTFSHIFSFRNRKN